MAETEDAIILPVTLNDEQARVMWDSLKARFKNDPITPEVLPPNPEVEKGFRSLADVLKDHRVEMRRESGIAKVLARDFAMLGLEAKGLGGEIAHLVSAFAMGGVFMGGVAAAKLLVTTLQEIGADKAAKVKEWSDNAIQDLKQATKEVQAFNDALMGIVPARRRELEVAEQIKENQKEIAALEKGLAEDEVKRAAIHFGEDVRFGQIDRLKQANRDLEADRVKRHQQAEQEIAMADAKRLDLQYKQQADANLKAQQQLVNEQLHEQQLRREHVVAMRGLTVQGELITANDREKVQLESEQKIAVLELQAREATLKREFDTARRIREIIVKERQNTAAELAHMRDLEDGHQALAAIHAAEARATKILEVEQYYDNLRLTKGDEAKARELTSLQQHYGELELLFADDQEYLTQIQAEYSRKRVEIFKVEAEEYTAVVDFMKQEAGSLVQSLGSQYGHLLQWSAAFSSAMDQERQAALATANVKLKAAQQALDLAKKAYASDSQNETKKKAVEQATVALANAEKEQSRAAVQASSDMGAALLKFTQDTLANISQQAAVKAIFETAEGFAAEAITWGVPNPSSIAHFAAAAQFGMIAGAAGAGALAIGAARPMTNAEASQAASGSVDTSGIDSGTAAGASAGASATSDSLGARGASNALPAQVVRETIFVVGDPYETPAETARRAARAYNEAQRLELLRRG